QATPAAAGAASASALVPPAATPPAANTPAAPGHSAALATWQTASNAAALDATPTREISVAMHSDDLGAVQLHASLHDNVLGAAIAVDRPEVHNWLAAQLPELQRNL